MEVEEEVEEEDFASKEHHILVELFQACWYVILSHTDFICYAMVFLNQVRKPEILKCEFYNFFFQINSASILSLPLPLMVLTWGTLTFPRPSKTFWVTVIAYTQAVVIIKCVCQFEAWFWNGSVIPPNQPFAPARILGIEKKKGYATYDLILLLVVFCHRIILKSLGLWKSEVPDKEEVNESIKAAETSKEVVRASKEVIAASKEDIKVPDENGKTVRVVDERDTVVVEETPEEGNVYLAMAKISFLKYASSIKEFIRQLFDRESRQTADIYVRILLSAKKIYSNLIQIFLN